MQIINLRSGKDVYVLISVLKIRVDPTSIQEETQVKE